MNKTSYGILILILITTITYFSAGCNKDTSPVVTEYTIKVDSIHHADTINEGDDFNIDFFGEIGENDCYEFMEYRPTYDTDKISIELIGKHTARGNCIDGIIYMNPYTLSISNITAGTWTLRIQQPEGTTPIQSKFFVK